MKGLFERAEEFIWKNARLLERRLFEFHFRSGSSRAVLSALRAYQNKDGGFGNALEPDIRCPDSQPVPTQHALEIMDVVGFDEMMVGDMRFPSEYNDRRRWCSIRVAFCSELSACTLVEKRRQSTCIIESYSKNMWFLT